MYFILKSLQGGIVILGYFKTFSEDERLEESRRLGGSSVPIAIFPSPVHNKRAVKV